MAAVALLAGTPVFVLVALLRLFGRRCPLFTCELTRGIQDRTFRRWKFRTAAGAERADLASRLLRRTRLARLPELWSVVAGDMQLVGLHPVPAQVPRTPGMEVFHATPPGLVDFGRMLCPARCWAGRQDSHIDAAGWEGRVLALNQYWLQIRTFRLDTLVLLWSAGQSVWPSLFDCEFTWRTLVGSPADCGCSGRTGDGRHRVPAAARTHGVSCQ